MRVSTLAQVAVGALVASSSSSVMAAVTGTDNAHSPASSTPEPAVMTPYKDLPEAVRRHASTASVLTGQGFLEHDLKNGATPMEVFKTGRQEGDGIRLGSSSSKPALQGLTGAGEQQGGGDHDAYFQHHYYDVTYFTPQGLANDTNAQYRFVDIRNSPKAVRANVSDADDLPFEKVNLPFTWTFYGHEHTDLYINANGFLSSLPLYCSQQYQFCNWIPGYENDSFYTRYIAPFMTDLNPSASPDSTIHYVIDNELFNRKITVQWSDVVLFDYGPTQGAPQAYNQAESFTFQVVLNHQGDITFKWKTIPKDPRKTALNPPDANTAARLRYPLTIGVEDAVIVDNSYLRTYKPLNLSADNILTDLPGHSVHLEALPNCPSQPSCSKCLGYTAKHKDEPGRLQCEWCPSTNLCSDGVGREVDTLSFECYAKDQFIEDEGQCALGIRAFDQSDSLPGGYGFLVFLSLMASISLCLFGAVIWRKRALEAKGGGAFRRAEDGDGNGGLTEGVTGAYAMHGTADDEFEPPPHQFEGERHQSDDEGWEGNDENTRGRVESEDIASPNTGF